MNGVVFSTVSFHRMFSKATAWGQIDAQSMHSDPVNSSSLQKTTGGRKSLLERLKPDTPHQAQQKPDTAPKEPQYLDVTAAFFGRQRRQVPRVKNSQPSHHAHQLQHQKPQELPDELRTPEAPLASELRSELDQSIAAEGSHIYNNGATRLNDIYEALKGAVVDTSTKNNRVLARARFQNKNIIKPLAEMNLKETLIDNDGKTTSRQVHVGEQVDSIYERIKVLEAEVGQLWDEWEAAEHEVQIIHASMTGSGSRGDLFVDQSEPTNEVHKSLAREMGKYEEELENILERSHEEARASEKEFSRKIIGVMSALLQQYLLGD